MNTDTRTDMTNMRKAAVIIGVLYIIGTVTGVIASFIMPSFGPGIDPLAQIAAHRGATVAGTLLVLAMGFSLSALAAIFYPIGHRFSEWLATGYVIFRGALEGMIYVISALLWLTLIALASAPASAAMTPVARAIMTSNDVIWSQLVSMPFAIGALMFYALLHRARLLPSWILIWCYISVALFMAANLAQLFGLGNIDFVMASIFLQEMVLAGWLIVKGFNPEALASVGLGSSAEDKPRTTAPNPQVFHPAPGV
jgi:hypothetical protein